jgi:hypothetical protein
MATTKLEDAVFLAKLAEQAERYEGNAQSWLQRVCASADEG